MLRVTGSKAKIRRGFTLVEIMITVSIIALLTAIVIPSVIAMKRVANEAAAKSNMRILSTAAETYMAARGHYPTTVAEFEEFLVPAQVYCADLGGTPTEIRGYSYSCSSNNAGYTFEAQPTNPGVSGNIIYTATTGSVLTPP